MQILKNVRESADFIKSRLDVENAALAVVLGSGFNEGKEQFTITGSLDYADIPHFRKTGVSGHEGKCLSAKNNDGSRLILFSGRKHMYEGLSAAESVFHVYVSHALGVKNLLLTNAAGGINFNLNPGDIMLIEDHISLFIENPLKGENALYPERRFTDMSSAYSKRFRDEIIRACQKKGITLKEGIYAALQGPSFESPAEIQLLRQMLCDAVGMSTAAEAIVAAHCGMECAGLSFISNPAAGRSAKSLSHSDVKNAAENYGKRIGLILSEAVNAICNYAAQKELKEESNAKESKED